MHLPTSIALFPHELIIFINNNNKLVIGAEYSSMETSFAFLGNPPKTTLELDSSFKEKSKTLATQALWVVIMLGCIFLAVSTTQTMFSDYLDHQTATLITIRQCEMEIISSKKNKPMGNYKDYLYWRKEQKATAYFTKPELMEKWRANAQIPKEFTKLGEEVFLKFDGWHIEERIQKSRMLLPSVTVCPKNPDSLNYGMVIRDIGKKLPRMDRITLARLMAFAIAGAGLNNVDLVINQVSPDEMSKLSSLFRRWKGSRTLVEFYKDLFEKYGYKCEEFLAKCFYGSQKISCCDVFRPHYVMLRGRCFRIDKFYQTDPDVLGKLTIWMNQMPSKISDRMGIQPQSIAYISDRFPDVATFPRLYVDFHESTYLRVKGRKMVLLPWNNDCSMSPEFHGKACYVRKWLRTKIIEPLNCTVFYLKDKFPGYPVCDPEVIVRNYKTVTNTSLSNTDGIKCVPACHRFDHQMRPFRSETSTPGRFPVPDFRLELSYTELEIERYEEFLTTNFPGLVSQLGGQSGLFIGTSACTIIQILLSFSRTLSKFFHTVFFQYTMMDLFY